MSDLVCACVETDRGTDTLGCPLHGQTQSEPDSDAYGGVPPYVAASDTSAAAAASMIPSAGSLRATVLRYVVESGGHGATDAEIQEALKLDGNTQRPRRCELVSGGYVIRTDRQRKTSAGRWAFVYAATGAGRAWAGIADDDADLEIER